MPLLGAHMSIEGGLHKAFERISLIGGQSLQIFSKNQRQWRVPELSPSEIKKFIDLPIGVGFGISDAESAAKVATCSDAVVVGSVLVKKMTLNDGNTEPERAIIIKEISDILVSMRSALDS